MSPVDALLARWRTELAAVVPSHSDDGLSLPLMESTFGADEIIEVLESLLTTRVTMGAKVARFEREFADHVGTRHAIMVNSGSSANLLIMAALTNPRCPAACRLQPGDEVIVPAVTWSTTLWPIIQMGCIPVLVDCRLDTLNLDVTACAAAVTPRTRAIWPAHIMGNAVDLQATQSLADRHQLIVMEDACEALGTRWRGRHVGTLGLMGSYSFFFSHHMTTIEGGMIVTNDDMLADLCRCLRAHGWTRDMREPPRLDGDTPIDPKFCFVNVGYNLRPTELQAGFGLHQLPKLAAMNARRNATFVALADGLRDCPIVQCARPTPGCDPAWFGFPVVLAAAAAPRYRAFRAHLAAHGIETRPILAGNLADHPALPLFPHRVAGPLPNAAAVMQRGLYWACHPSMTERHVKHIVDTVTTFSTVPD